jgi:hypothetical protein
LTIFKVSAIEGHSYIPWKFLMNVVQRWSKVLILFLGRLMSYDQAALDNDVGK